MKSPHSLIHLEVDEAYVRGHVHELMVMAKEFKAAGDDDLYHFTKATAVQVEALQHAIHRRLRAKRAELDERRRKRKERK